MRKATLNHSAHRKEAQSKRSFAKLIEPSIVTWTQQDYGLDGLVQLSARELPSGSAEMDTSFFLVQLKSTSGILENESTFSYPTEVNKLLEWSKANVDILLVVNDLNNNLFYGKWIDSEFVNQLNIINPSWPLKNKISIKFSNNDLLTQDVIKSFNEYLNRTRTLHRSLRPGQYFEYRDKLKDLLETMRSMATPFHLGATEKRIIVLSDKLETAIYRIAIAGPSRAGKSTMINALLRKDISPVGIFQTTGVPIQIIPGKEDKITVYFKDNKKVEESFSSAAVKKYASQSGNLDNVKKVKFVGISIINTELEKGISFFDVPGLDDPDDEILTPTIAYVRSCNAIVYMIDGSSMATGGFAFKAEYKTQLQEMSSTMDKVFLVVNKVDSLNDQQLQELKGRVEFDLRRFNLHNKIDGRISFVSTGQSFKARTSKNSTEKDSVLELEQHIWQYLLEGNKTGVYRLVDVLQEIIDARNEFADLLNARLLNSAQLDQLHDAMESMRNRLPELETIFSFKAREVKESLKKLIVTKKHELYSRLEQDLKAVPQNQDLPKDSTIKKFLIYQLQQIIEAGNQSAFIEVNKYKSEMDKWIELNLKKIREIINTNPTSRQVDFTPIESLLTPKIDLSSSWGMGIVGAIVGLFLNPQGALMGALIGFFGHLFLSSEDRRAKKIQKIIDASRKRCDTVFTDLEEKFSQGTDEMMLAVYKYGIEKISLYFTDLNNQIAQINTKHLSQNERTEHKQCIERIKKLDLELNTLHHELLRYT